ncbi:hypothetical protein BDR07DRAFT_476381 [Suillus spraguei]|nr:hypothetical protein BDR07DRAFT_476381 [Suillus spraguei]
MSVCTAHCKRYSSTLPADRDASIGAATLQPLFAFRNLRKLDFNSAGCSIVLMDDAVLLEMAKAWPHLEELYISRYSCSSHTVTPHAFVLLLRHCPHLVSVAVTINRSTIDVHTRPPDIPHQGFSHNALFIFFSGGSQIRNPTSIAAFISTIAPNVRSIKGSNRADVPDEWRMVEELLGTSPIICSRARE